MVRWLSTICDATTYGGGWPRCCDGILNLGSPGADAGRAGLPPSCGGRRAIVASSVVSRPGLV